MPKTDNQDNNRLAGADGRVCAYCEQQVPTGQDLMALVLDSWGMVPHDVSLDGQRLVTVCGNDHVAALAERGRRAQRTRSDRAATCSTMEGQFVHGCAVTGSGNVEGNSHAAIDAPAPSVPQVVECQEPRPRLESATSQANSPQRLKFGVRRFGDGAVVVTVRGDLNLLTAPRLVEMVRYGLRGAVCVLVIDLSELDFLGVAGLAVLVQARTWAGACGIALRVVIGQNHSVIRALTITGLHRDLSISVTNSRLDR
jgi:anti-sigma B factor antagonist